MSTKDRFALFTGSLLLALVCGWGSMHLVWPLVFLGYVGAIFFVFVDGVHGGNKAQDVIGGLLYVSVNTIVFYCLLRYSLGLIRQRFASKN